MTMTWGEFKEHMQQNGIEDQMEIWFLDITLPHKEGNNLHVHPHDKHDDECLGVTVTNE